MLHPATYAITFSTPCRPNIGPGVAYWTRQEARNAVQRRFEATTTQLFDVPTSATIRHPDGTLEVLNRYSVSFVAPADETAQDRRERLLRFATNLGDPYRKFGLRLGDTPITYASLTTEALEDLCDDMRRNFWFQKRIVRENREVVERMKAQQATAALRTAAE